MPDGSCKDICTQCRMEIKTQIFKDTGICCELCRKVRDGEISPSEYITQKDVQNVPRL